MPYKELKLLGFTPDLPQTAEGGFLEQRYMLPTPRGIRTGPAMGITQIAVTMNANSLGCAMLKKIDGTKRYYAGTTTKLYELSATGSTATDRSGAAYSASTTQTWSFCQFGDVSLAANKGDTIQASSGAAFAAVAAAPKASIIVTGGPPTLPFVMAFNYNDGTDTPDGYYSCKGADYTNWTVSIADGCQKGRLYEDTGKIVAAVKFRDGFLAFKESSMYLATYAPSSTTVWRWTRIASGIGCAAKNLACVVNDTVYFADKNGFWVFDGSYPRKLPGFLHNYWTNTVLLGNSSELSQMIYDQSNHNLWVGANDAAGSATQYLVYNTISQLWTKQTSVFRVSSGTKSAREIVTFEAGTLNDQLATTDGAYADLFDYSGGVGATYPAPFFTLNYFGQPIDYTSISRVILLLEGSARPDATSTVQVAAYKSPATAAGTQFTSASTTIDSARVWFDATAQGNYLSITINPLGSAEISGVGLVIEPAGAYGKK